MINLESEQTFITHVIVCSKSFIQTVNIFIVPVIFIELLSNNKYPYYLLDVSLLVLARQHFAKAFCLQHVTD